ncbi:metallophosphoesterase [Christensenella timonensis]|uniref:metallophosphoesterase n=1 Tax=Christensenella timonensis TaxID=1816678 RepID=UPI000831FD81|nr:metallophosphoesterase [Christensenella timonensis]
MFNNNTVQITSYGILSDKVASGVVVAHLSDLHEKEFGARNGQLFRKVEKLMPDIIAVTGDMVAHEHQKGIDARYTKQFARTLAGIAPAYFVTGNHERNFDGQIEDIMQEYGVTVLRSGDLQKVRAGGNEINIAGMDDISFNGVDVMDSVNVFSETSGFNIFLAHRPEYYPLYLHKNIDLVLSGHTHAGQIRFPKIGAFAMSGQGFMPKYVEGEFTDGATTMIISRGLGSSGYPKIRINNPPELVAIYIEPDPKDLA